MEAMTMQQKRKEFARMYRTGGYLQKDIARILKIREATASLWARELSPVLLCAAKRNLTKELHKFTVMQKYADNRDTIRSLISDIERVDKLIKRAYNAQI